MMEGKEIPVSKGGKKKITGGSKEQSSREQEKAGDARNVGVERESLQGFLGGTIPQTSKEVATIVIDEAQKEGVTDAPSPEELAKTPEVQQAVKAFTEIAQEQAPKAKGEGFRKVMGNLFSRLAERFREVEFGEKCARFGQWCREHIPMSEAKKERIRRERAAKDSEAFVGHAENIEIKGFASSPPVVGKKPGQGEGVIR